MSKDLKPIILYGKGQGSPNPWKIGIFLEELGLPYTVKHVPQDQLKLEPYISLNPNGRVPTIEDPNSGLTIWESGAIIEYLLETYDKEKRLSFSTPEEKWQAKAWLYFQVSGQGPYYGQLAWFHWGHPEKIPSAIERYANETKRVTAVIEHQLAKHGKHYILGEKLSYVDLAWFIYQFSVKKLFLPDWDQSGLPHYCEWMQRMEALESVQRAFKHPDLANSALFN